jgi:hypothetical protein
VKRFLIPTLLAVSVAAVVLAIVVSRSSDETASTEAVGSGQTTTSAAAPPGSTGPAQLDDNLSVPTSGWKTNFKKFTVSLSEFAGGGPGKDGIPSIDAPTFTSVREADSFLEAREPVVEFVGANGEARAYPLQILIWHEIVNDTVGDVPVTVTFCPLCNTTIVFDRRLDGRVLDFGVSGNLRNSDLVMYDRQTETWWQQFGGVGVVGDLAGKELTKLPAEIVAWEDFKREHPDGRVLSRDTGSSRSYGQNPYAGYDSIDSPPFFAVKGLDDARLQPKERVVFLERGEERIVVPFAVLAEKKKIEVEIAGERLEVTWKAGTRSALDAGDIASAKDVGTATVRSVDTGELVVFDVPFWFAVAAFAGDAEIVTG